MVLSSMFQTESPGAADGETTQLRSKNPFEFITNFFRRKTKEPYENKNNTIEILEDKTLSEDEGHHSSSEWDDQTDSGISFREIDGSPVLSLTQKNLNPKKLDEDMEYLRLSRHDNPVLQRHLSSSSHSFEASGNSSNCNEDQDTQHLVSTMDEIGDEDFVHKNGFYNQMHEHLIRSPPPNPCSLPEISASNNIFMFPPFNKSEQSRSLEPLHMLTSTPLDAQNGNNVSSSVYWLNLSLIQPFVSELRTVAASTFNIMGDIVEEDRLKVNIKNYEAVAIVKSEEKKREIQKHLSKRIELNPVQTKRGSEMIDPTLRQLLNAQNKADKPTYSRSSSSPLPSDQGTLFTRIGSNSRSAKFSTPAQPLSSSLSKENYVTPVHQRNLTPLKSRPD
ncbi:hypothetical protein GQR58_016102 [Nymphon striatum]|nr:hypothetical protein GQR58_016102 [Nymphon striatum]